MLSRSIQTVRGGLCVGLALTMTFVPWLCAPALADQGLGAIRGLLYMADETSRLPGATVTAINVKTGRRYVSNHTGDNGAYEVTGLPAGTYDISIDLGDRLFVTDTLIDLAEGQRLYLSYSVQPKGAVKADTSGKDQAKMTFTDPSAVPQPAETPSKKKKGFWNSAGGITVISILVAGAVGAGVASQQN